jgi:hypothetical protein
MRLINKLRTIRPRHLLLLTCAMASVQAQPIGNYQHGTVVRMRMGDCLPSHRGFVSTFGGPQTPAPEETCPEYTLISEKVVFVIVGKSSNQLIPLADVIDFRLNKSELAVRMDDSKRESRFNIKEMILRSEWERVQKHIDDELDSRQPKGSVLSSRN